MTPAPRFSETSVPARPAVASPDRDVTVPIASAARAPFASIRPPAPPAIVARNRLRLALTIL